MALVEEYLYKIRDSLKHLSGLLPKNSLLLVEGVSEVDLNHHNTGKPLVTYYECYLVAKPSKNDLLKYDVWGGALLVGAPELGDLYAHVREEAVGNWLSDSSQSPKGITVCINLEESITERDDIVFTANRADVDEEFLERFFPSEHYGEGNIEFKLVLKR